MNYTVDGTQALADQENTLNGLEMANFSQVIRYEKQSTGTDNLATMADAPPGYPRLYVASVDVGASTAQTIQQHKTAGRSLLFTGMANVSGSAKTVMGFRQTP
jgi:hypothetical protein